MSTRDDSSPTPEADDPLFAIVGEYAAAIRRGDGADVEDWAARFPAHAERIRQIFPTLALLERATPAYAAEPTVLGNYRILRRLGQGGMGVVYEAIQESLGRRVALKTLPVQATLDAHFLERFKREAQAVAKLAHPHIVDVYETGEANGVHFYAMRYVDGLGLDVLSRELRERTQGKTSGSALSSLASKLWRTDFSRGSSTTTGQAPLVSRADDGAPAPVIDTPHLQELEPRDRARYQRNVAEIGAQIADALAHAHSIGVLHRDVKPSNLLLDARGDAWLTDFGLAKTDDSGDLTQAGDILGTLRYMAPERFEGHSDRRGDVYALGITLYELATLTNAFGEGTRAEITQRVLSGKLEPPRKLDSSIPVDLETIILKSIATNIDERYTDAGALATDLRAFLAGRPIMARPTSAIYALELIVRRNKVASALLAGALISCVLLAAFYVHSLIEARDQALLAQAEQARLAASANVASAEAALRTNDVVRARTALDTVSERYRDWEWHHLENQIDTSARTWRGTGHNIWACDVSPDGRRLAAGEEGRVFVIDLGLDSLVREWKPSGGNVSHMRFSPDGKAIAIGCFGVLAQVFDVESGALLGELRGHREQTVAVCWQPEGRWLATGSYDQSVRIWDANDYHELRVLEPRAGQIDTVQVSPDGSRLACAGWSGTIVLYDCATWTESARWHTHTARIMDIDFSPDSRRIASACMDSTAAITDIATGERQVQFVGHTTGLAAIRFSPDGRRLATAGDFTIGIWDVSSGGMLRKLLGHSGAVTGLSFSADGARLVSSGRDSRLKEWSLDDPGVASELLGHFHDVESLAFSADGRRLLTGGLDTTVRVWDLVSGSTVAVLLGHQDGICRAVWSADERLILSSSYDSTLRLWDGSSFTELAILRGHESAVMDCAFSADARRAFSGSLDHTLRIWDVETRSCIDSVDDNSAEVWSVAVSADGKWIAWGLRDGRVRLGAVDAVHSARDIHHYGHLVFRLQFRADSQRLFALDEGGELIEFDLPDGRPVRRISTRDPDSDVGVRGTFEFALREDGRRAAVAGMTSIIQLLDLERGSVAANLFGGSGWMSVGMTRDGSAIASGHADAKIRLWRDRPLAGAAEAHTRARALERDVRSLVEKILQTTLEPDEVARQLAACNELDAEHRRAAESLVQAANGDADRLEAWAYSVLRDPTRPRDDYLRVAGLIHPLFRHHGHTSVADRRASLRGQSDVRLAQRFDEGPYINFDLIGVSRESLLDSGLRNLQQAIDGPGALVRVDDVAFMVLAEVESGNFDQARAQAARLTDLADGPRPPAPELRGLIDEAHAALAGMKARGQPAGR